MRHIYFQLILILYLATRLLTTKWNKLNGGGGGNEDEDSGSQTYNNCSLNMSNINQNIEDDDNDVLQETCNWIVDSLNKKNFGSGGKVRCVNI